jgi:hypothetical protein
MRIPAAETTQYKLLPTDDSAYGTCSCRSFCLAKPPRPLDAKPCAQLAPRRVTACQMRSEVQCGSWGTGMSTSRRSAPRQGFDQDARRFPPSFLRARIQHRCGHVAPSHPPHCSHRDGMGCRIGDGSRTAVAEREAEWSECPRSEGSPPSSWQLCPFRLSSGGGGGIPVRVGVGDATKIRRGACPLVWKQAWALRRGKLAVSCRMSNANATANAGHCILWRGSVLCPGTRCSVLAVLRPLKGRQ